MKIATTIKEVRKQVADWKREGLTVGLVPTMGALHEGHASLVDAAKEQCDRVVTSVFVNPTQFAAGEDLDAYPRDFDRDCGILEAHGCDLVFHPGVEEMYPEEDTRVFELGPVAEVMEGKYRPGHFNGVAQIVSKLFYAVTPDRAYFGEKDFQQIAVIRSMVKLINSPVEIVDCPIVREEDGLALSSRNRRLTPEQRKNALNISATLFKSRTFAQNHTVAETLAFVVDTINAVDGLEVEYYEIVDGRTLLPVESWDQTDYVVGCVTVYCGEVRLIDNVIYHR